MSVKISVIIPVYNVEKYLRECLDSVINQTLKDIEIICVDDGSTDESGKILDEYAAKDSRFKVIHKQNEGAAIARNKGIEISCGEYLLILDSDDIFDSAMLEKMMAKASENDATITICRAQCLDNQTKIIQRMNWTVQEKYLSGAEVFCTKDIKDHAFDFCVGWSWDKLYKRDFVVQNKLEFQSLRSSNDLYFVFLSLVLADKITVLNEVLITHRKNTGSSLSETRSKDPLCFAKAILKLKESLVSKGLYDEYERAFVNWVVQFCFWHLDTINTKKGRKIIENYLKQNLADMIDLHLETPDYYFNSELYVKLKSFLDLRYRLSKSIFNIVNSANNKRKVVTILGIKIKIK